MDGPKWAKTQEPGYDSCVGHAAVLFLAVYRSTPPVIPISGQLRHLAVADLGLSLVVARLEKKNLWWWDGSGFNILKGFCLFQMKLGWFSKLVLGLPWFTTSTVVYDGYFCLMAQYPLCSVTFTARGLWANGCLKTQRIKWQFQSKHRTLVARIIRQGNLDLRIYTIWVWVNVVVGSFFFFAVSTRTEGEMNTSRLNTKYSLSLDSIISRCWAHSSRRLAMSSMAQRDWMQGTTVMINSRSTIYLDSVFSQGKFEAIACSERKGCCSPKKAMEIMNMFSNVFLTSLTRSLDQFSPIFQTDGIFRRGNCGDNHQSPQPVETWSDFEAWIVAGFGWWPCAKKHHLHQC